jgi:hypothetical protein
VAKGATARCGRLSHTLRRNLGARPHLRASVHSLKISHGHLSFEHSIEARHQFVLCMKVYFFESTLHGSTPSAACALAALFSNTRCTDFALFTLFG